MKKKILIVADAACGSGFARGTHGILETLAPLYDVTVLGINYNGDPHDYPYPIYAAAPGGDSFGIGRIVWACDLVTRTEQQGAHRVHSQVPRRPDAILIQQDGWNVPFYIQQLKSVSAYASIPVVAVVAIDGVNFNGRWLDGVSHAIFWTDFAKREARRGGYIGSASVIPLGVDLKAFRPMDKMAARHARQIDVLGDAFIVGNINRNQPRKRWDLMLRYFAKWIKQLGPGVLESEIHNAPVKITDAYLYLHVAPTGDHGIDVRGLASYYGIFERLALLEPPTFYGVSEQEMADTYGCLDVYASTTQGEGMGLPAMEAMASRVACVLPDWSAYGCWARGAGELVPCTSTHVGPPYQNVIGGVVDEVQFIKALDVLYHDKEARTNLADRGFARISEERFRWEDVGARYADVLDNVLGIMKVVVHVDGAAIARRVVDLLPEEAI